MKLANYLSLFSIIVLLFYPDNLTGITLCPFFNLTSIPCPGCGVGRGLVCIYHFNFLQALKYNPFSYLIAYYQIKIGIVAFFIKNNNFIAEMFVTKWNIVFLFLLGIYWITRMIVWSYFPEYSDLFFIDIRKSEKIFNFIMRVLSLQ